MPECPQTSPREPSWVTRSPSRLRPAAVVVAAVVVVAQHPAERLVAERLRPVERPRLVDLLLVVAAEAAVLAAELAAAVDRVEAEAVAAQPWQPIRVKSVPVALTSRA